MGKKGFTLLELVITMVILGILVGVGTPVYFSHVKEARMSEAKLNIDRIVLQLKSNLTRYGYMGTGEINTGPSMQLSCTKADLESRLGMTLPVEIKDRWDIDVSAQYYFTGDILNLSGTIVFTGTSSIPFNGTIKVTFDLDTLEFTVE
ncbi:MAG TPA: prepilin-type N-terminal cleavage/methylation domain-containing protein [Candidatus Mcinerneyibacteriales bacterium]|jgi:prepilin-type N-terminal cleavage/methylation domain-containing protein|nr:prepilin-type N-terminal cleavage/methylation domain-containing protein [Candidatus Mcinerneyibacteriales bacterium]HPE20936.1 prepilin-type N-terminal cleavage/methylation domain-containing protein [Candidatus Mcinerneyibacteriales bacterium]HPJ69756.1 prepilin-type N-terminal cleavage/methylation domain-containing protein [Candidatus Mcinerneyibacteriales bacterium]HPQ89990.1 prepilin-type N-terminal cleavage/methylation domain-containing protein [Candidatus Mcinerneyibacteriales bacterium]